MGTINYLGNKFLEGVSNVSIPQWVRLIRCRILCRRCYWFVSIPQWVRLIEKSVQLRAAHYIVSIPQWVRLILERIK